MLTLTYNFPKLSYILGILFHSLLTPEAWSMDSIYTHLHAYALHNYAPALCLHFHSYHHLLPTMHTLDTHSHLWLVYQTGICLTIIPPPANQ